jgi:hypothetical protein
MNVRWAGFLAAGLSLAFLSPGAGAKSDKGPHLRYAATYAGAIQEARARNALVFVSFHKDH